MIRAGRPATVEVTPRPDSGRCAVTLRRSIKELLWRLRRHHFNDTAAVLSFYAVVSLPPFLVLTLTLAARLLGRVTAGDDLEEQLANLIGADAGHLAIVLVGTLRHAGEGNRGLGLFVPLLLLLASGSQVLSKLREYLTAIFHTEPLLPRRPILIRILWRIVVGLLLLALALLATLSTLLNSFADQVAAILSANSATFNFVTTQVLQTLVGAFLIWLTGTLLLKALPARRPSWRAAAGGALLTAPAMVAYKFGLELYFRHAMLGSILGSGLALVTLCFWLYLSMATLLFAAELAALIDERHQRKQARRRQPRTRDAAAGSIHR